MTRADDIADTRATMLTLLAEGAVPAPETIQDTYVKWTADDHQLVLRFGLDGSVSFDPYWHDEQGWDHFFAPMRFDFYPWVVAAVSMFLDDPCRVTALQISNGAYKVAS